MSEDAPDERQPHAACSTKARISVPQIVEPHIGNPGSNADPAPLLVEAIEMPLTSLTGKNPDLIA
jgi:hypothetical protein